jgi:hypothetical protein
MDEGQHADATPQSSGFISSVWAKARERAEGIAVEIVHSMFFLAGLTIWFLGLRFMAILGYPAGRIRTLETIHYWAYLPTVVSFLLRFSLEAITAAFTWRKN